MQRSERRRGGAIPSHVLERQLNEAQRVTLRGLERFGLSLVFVRRPMFQQPVGVVQDPAKKTYVLIEADGTINDKVDLKARF